MMGDDRRQPEDEAADPRDELARESEERYRAIADSVSEGIILHLDGKVLDVNEAACKLFGYHRSEMIGMPVQLLAAPESRDLVIEKIRSGDTNPYEAVGVRKDGTRIVGELRATYVPYQGRRVRVAAVRDITDRKRAEEALRRSVAEQRGVEEQLRQVQKLDSVGRLAGGIAHDLNNVLTAVLGYGALLADGIRSGRADLADLDEIIRAAERARDLTQHLLAFARKQVMAPRVVDPNAVVQEAERLLRRLLSEDIAIELHLANDAGSIEADPGRVGEVIVNLALNARDAMPQGGTLTIETANVDLDDLYATRHPGTVEPGPHVMIAVSDTGVGMSHEVLEHIFEPFYTTKPVGKGTGLGLAVAYGIVKQSGGHIWAYSEPGTGSTLKMYFPRAAGPQTGTERASRAEVRGGAEQILVVEDDPAVNDIAVRRLESAGYRVRSASHGAEALAIAGSLSAPVDLLLTDVVMPGMSGREVADQLQQRWPDLRVLYMSGYTGNAIVHHGVLEPGIALLPKPFSAAALLTKVREVLDAAPGRA